MATLPDDDVAQAVTTKWLANATIVAAVPGGLHTGTRAQAGLLRPYALLDVRQGPTSPSEGLMAPRRSGGPWIDFRHVTIRIWGTLAQVRTALAAVRTAFDATTAPVLSVPNVTATMDVRPLQPQDELAEDEKAKEGEDQWIGTAEWEILCQRVWP